MIQQALDVALGGVDHIRTVDLENDIVGPEAQKQVSVMLLTFSLHVDKQKSALVRLGVDGDLRNHHRRMSCKEHSTAHHNVERNILPNQ